MGQIIPLEIKTNQCSLWASIQIYFNSLALFIEDLASAIHDKTITVIEFKISKNS